MLTLDKLRDFGADISDGMGRCLNNEDMYIRLVNMALADKSFAALDEALENDDIKAAFEAAHSLKGITGNLALTPLFKPVSELTELLRPGQKTDCGSLPEEIRQQYKKLKELAED